MEWYRNLRMVGKIVFQVAAALILALGILCWQILSRSSAAIEAVAGRELAALAAQHGNSVKNFFDIPLYQATGLAKATEAALVSGARIDRELYLEMLRGLEENNSAFLGVGSGWEPNGFDGKDGVSAGKTGSDERGRFIPYLVKGSKPTLLENLDSSEYYAEPKKRRRN